MSILLNFTNNTYRTRTIELTKGIIESSDIPIKDDSIINVVNNSRNKVSNASSDINASSEMLQIIKPEKIQSYFVKDMTRNENASSTKPYLNIFYFKTNNSKVCYAYFTPNFTHPLVEIVGIPNTLYTLFEQYNTDKTSGMTDKIIVDSGKIYYGADINSTICPVCSKCEVCPEQVKCNSCCPVCPICPKCEVCQPPCKCEECEDCNPYKYGLYATSALLFISICILIYIFSKS